MPQRFLKPGIVSSRKWDGLPWMSQSFYIRVITLVDDFGRYLADSVLLKNQCFPLREDIRASQVLDLCQDLDRAQLAIFYKVDGKEFLQLTNWTERKRSEASHYPPHTSPKAVLMFPQPSAAERSEPQPPKSESESKSKPESKSESKPSPYEVVSKRIDADYQREQGKRLHGIPASVEEVIAYGKRCNPPVSEDRCRAFWAHYEGQSKTNHNGDTFWVTSGQGGEIIVTKWTVKLPQFGMDYSRPKASAPQPETGRTAPVWAQIKSLEKTIELKKKALPTVAAPHQYEKPETYQRAVERNRVAMAELKELKGQLAKLHERQAKGEV